MSEHNVSSFRFRAFLLTQFCGALNDNIYKLTVSFLILAELSTWQHGNSLYYLAQAAFFLPFIFLSPYAGYLADRFSKSTVMQLTKVFEFVVMTLALLLLIGGYTIPLVVIIFLMGLHSTVFSPCKYGILPEVLEPRHLAKGNGHVELWTYLAILLGTIIAPQLVGFGLNSRLYIGITVVLVATVGLLASFYLPQTKPTDSSPSFLFNPFTQVIHDLIAIKQLKRAVFLCFFAIVYFWFIAAAFQANILLYAKNVLGFSEYHAGLLLIPFSIGIGLGSLFAGYVSEGKVELGLVPLGSAGISIFFLLLGGFPDQALIRWFSIFLLGASAGVFIVPLNSFFQERTPVEHRGSYLACLNVFSFAAMVLAVATLAFLDKFFQFTPARAFIVLGALSVIVAISIFYNMPLMLARCLNWLLTHFLYRVTIVGSENIPHRGGALIVCNHVTYTDPSILLSTIDRRIRFLVYRPIYELWYIKPFAKLFRCIPVAEEDDPKSTVQAIKTAREAIQNGELVCIFAEGALTRHGNMLPFKKGLEHIMRGIHAPIIPVYLDQAWGSIFSYKEGKILWKLPKELPYPVTLAWGKPLDPEVKAWQIRTAIQELSASLYPYRKTAHRLLHTEFIQTACKYPHRICITDSLGNVIRYRKLLIASLCLAEILRTKLTNKKMVGLILPPSLASAVSNLALYFAGKIPININYTSSLQSQNSAVAQCDIDTIITSRLVLQRLQREQQANMIFAEDLKPLVTWKMKLKYAIICTFLSSSLINRFIIKTFEKPTDLATVIFSSGSTGEPKGIMLSHANNISNLSAIYDILAIRKKESLLGVLPFFHSFGFTGTLWFPLLAGLQVNYHYNPMDCETIGKICKEQKVSMIIATPTFLLNYIRRCTAQQFKHLHYAVVGAEKLKEYIALLFHEKFGVLPLEGYGCTELSPVAIANIPDVNDLHNYQVGQKLGTVGHPIPGVAVRIVHPETREVLGIGVEGLMEIKGANVMLGYLHDQKRTEEAIRDGWYNTGDIAMLDQDGFVKITDRLARFSKIAGEMVPHIKIEEEIHKILGTEEQVCVVCGVTDERKGERLVVLHTQPLNPTEIVHQLAKTGIPNLWIPKKNHFFNVFAFPILGTGKLDLRNLKELATTLMQEQQKDS